MTGDRYLNYEVYRLGSSMTWWYMGSADEILGHYFLFQVLGPGIVSQECPRKVFFFFHCKGLHCGSIRLWSRHITTLDGIQGGESSSFLPLEDNSSLNRRKYLVSQTALVLTLCLAKRGKSQSKPHLRQIPSFPLGVPGHRGSGQWHWACLFYYENKTGPLPFLLQGLEGVHTHFS